MSKIEVIITLLLLGVSSTDKYWTKRQMKIVEGGQMMGSSYLAAISPLTVHDLFGAQIYSLAS